MIRRNSPALRSVPSQRTLPGLGAGSMPCCGAAPGTLAPAPKGAYRFPSARRPLRPLAAGAGRQPPPRRILFAGADQTGLVGEDDRLGPVPQAELGQHAADVGLDG